MKKFGSEFAENYQAKLRGYLRGKLQLKVARTLGKEAVSAHIQMIDVARIHDRCVSGETRVRPPGESLTQLINKAGTFFTEVITPIEANHCSAGEAAIRLTKLIKTLDKRTLELAASNRELKDEIASRARTEDALRKSERHYAKLLKESAYLQERLRNLSHRVLSTQEEERKRISRELHDQIAASLSGINIELASLKKETTGNNQMLRRRINHTQRLVQESVEMIHAFARDLRPTALDDLGLIPALHSFTKTFFRQSGIRARLQVASEVESLDNQKRTVLYRVTQEALTNVLRHARASRVAIIIGIKDGTVSLSIRDNGQSFKVEPLLHSPKNKRLGLLGMRERVEMVGGRFRVESVPDRGTTIQAFIPMQEKNGANGAVEERK